MVLIIRKKIKRITQNEIDKVVVLYEDRLLRFGFELVEYVASLYNCDIEVVDTTEKTEQQELVEDMIQIVKCSVLNFKVKEQTKLKK